MEAPVSGQANNNVLTKPAHALDASVLCKELESDPIDGLSATKAQSRTTEYGKNELLSGPGVQPLKILLHQVANAMILVSR